LRDRTHSAILAPVVTNIALGAGRHELSPQHCRPRNDKKETTMAQPSMRSVRSSGATSPSVVVEPPPVPRVPGAAEAFFNDFRAAMHDYPEQFVTLEVVDVDFSGNVINTREEGSFMVQLTNNGLLDMTGVTLKVRGLAGTQVKTGGAADFDFRDELTIGMESDTILGQGGVSLTNGSKLQFKAPGGPKPEGTALFKATIEAWNGSLVRILDNHSHDEPVAPAGIYENEVVDR
jgi:hypothetical protein